MKNVFYLSIIMSLASILSCSKEDNVIQQYDIVGLAQKGPFMSGSNITVVELNPSLEPTGLNFYSTVTDDFGSFSVPSVELSSSFIELMADGYFFNEKRGEPTDDRIVLKAIADLTSGSEININILTHISAERIKYLIKEEGKEFQEAKEQAELEILKIFNLEENDIKDYETLDISQDGEINSKLLAISSIIAGNKNISELTQLLAKIALDIKSDGKLNSEELQTELATSAVLCDIGSIRKHLSEYYDNELLFNTFQSYVKHFVETTEFQSLIDLDFSTELSDGVNLLELPDNAMLDTSTIYYLSQNINGSVSPFTTFTIAREAGGGEISYTPQNLQDWNYEPGYSGPYGIILHTSKINPASTTPMSVKFKGSGEIKLRIVIESPSLPDNGGLYVISKYLKW